MYHLERLNHRIAYIILVVLTMLSIIVGRLAYLQVLKGDHYAHRGKKNFMRIETVQSMRGNIVDQYGRLLATNRPVMNIIWQGTGNSTLSDEQKNILMQLETITKKQILNNPEWVSQIKHTEKQYKQLLIAYDLNFEQLSQIEEAFPHNPNILIQSDFKRHYPYHTTASHILGYLGREVETHTYGKMGLEKLCEDYLKGQPGAMVKMINSVGRHVGTTILKEAQNGADLSVTLDIDLQNICELIFPSYYSGTMIVMEPDNGAIRALVSRPSFDPELFLSPIPAQTWQDMQSNRPFVNRALCPYPPGSIFKLVTVSAALEHGLVKADASLFCPGYTTFAGRRYWCHCRWGHGDLTTSQAVAHSCNTLFFDIGRRIDIDLLAQYAHSFGLGLPTGFIFPEQTGIVPSRAWKKRERKESWWPGETLSAAIGQSFLLATPMQVARMIGSIFTGYLINPRILENQPLEKKPLTIKKETLEFLKQSMRFVVTRGTGRQVSTVKDVIIYAKTSTAQTSDFDKRTLGGKYLEHAWFVAYFQYEQRTPLVIVLLVENSGTSQIPTVIAKQFLIEYKQMLKQRDAANTSVCNSVENASEMPI